MSYYEYAGKIYRNLKVMPATEGLRAKVMCDPVPNPELISELFDFDVFFASATAVEEYDFESSANSEQVAEKIRKESGKNQDGIRMESGWNQDGIRMESGWNQQGSVANIRENGTERVRKRRMSPNSLAALPSARSLTTKDPYKVMQQNWPVIQYMQRQYGLAYLLEQKSFSRTYTREINEAFDQDRSPKFYLNLLRYYTEYKAQIEVPMWWLKVEVWLENNFFKYLID